MHKKVFIAILVLLAALAAQAKDFDFSATAPSGQTLYYSIIDKEKHEVEVVCPSSRLASNNRRRPWDGYVRPYGKVVLPSVVSHEGVDYEVVSIGWNAFEGCYEMKSLTFSKTIRDFQCTSFEYCRNLEEIIVHPDNPVFDSRGGCNAVIRTKENELVYGCRNTVIPNTVESIDWYAFRGSGLTSIVIPPSVKYIHGQAFYGCPLAEATIPATVEGLGYEAFETGVVLSLEASPLRLEKGRYYFDVYYDDEGYAHGICMVPCGMKKVYEASAWDRYYLFSEDCEEHTVGVDDAAGCGLQVSAGKAKFGDRVQISCSAKDYAFVIMSGTSPTYIEVKDNSFLMPAYDVTVRSVKL